MFGFTRNVIWQSLKRTIARKIEKLIEESFLNDNFLQN